MYQPRLLQLIALCDVIVCVARLQRYTADGHNGTRLLRKLRLPSHKFLCAVKVITAFLLFISLKFSTLLYHFHRQYACSSWATIACNVTVATARQKS